MKDLTPQQISSIWRAQSASGGRSFEDVIRAAIKADRELNGREAQPAEQRPLLEKRDLTGLNPANGAAAYFRGLGWNEAIDAMASQPAREWVDLPAPDTRTDAHIDTMGEPAYSVELVQSLFGALREKNAELPAEQANGRCVCPACKDGTIHASDCAVHNAPALPVGPCDCGLQPAALPDDIPAILKTQAS